MRTAHNPQPAQQHHHYYHPSSKLYPVDLYDQIKNEGNHIVCLEQEQTKTFILLAAIRNKAYQLRKKYGLHSTIIVEPDLEHANERHRILNDHTGLTVKNLFNEPDSSVGVSEENLSGGNVIIASMKHVIDQRLHARSCNLVILDHAHLLLLHDIEAVKSMVSLFNRVQLLVFMSSLIQNNHELVPAKILKLIESLERVFNAKCETSSDLRSLSRQSPVTSMEAIVFHPSELVTCDWFLLADSLLKSFCDLLIDSNLDNYVPIVKPEPDLGEDLTKGPVLSTKKQLILVRSCLADIIYAVHCLGYWCAKKTTQLHLIELSRLIQQDPQGCNLISAAQTMLNVFYGRLEELINNMNYSEKEGILLKTSAPQLISLLESIKEFKPSTTPTNSPICIIHVRHRVIAKVMALWLDKVASCNKDYSFIKSNYIVGSKRKHRNRIAVDNFDLHHEAAVRDFRFGNCNVIVTSAMGDRCTNMPKCSLVVSFDLPAHFSDFIRAKGNCRFDSSRYVLILNQLLDANSKARLLNYINLERLLSDSSKKLILDPDEVAIMESLEPIYEPYPSKNSKNPATIWRAIGLINKYCSKLPSDSFTKLSPEWKLHQVETKDGLMYFCNLKLPINSPVRQTIVGPCAPRKNIAMRLVALTACKVLHQAGELDDNMAPITKESMKALLTKNRPKDHQPTRPRGRGGLKSQSTGSTKHRQYYRKRIAKVLSGPLVSSETLCYLYKIKMILTCPIPDEQNRRGRRIIDPSETNRNYAIVCTTELPKICAFPIFTRSGEVMISITLIEKEFKLTNSQVNDLRVFHEYTFSKVLRLEKYPTVYNPDQSPFTILLAPVIDNIELNKTLIDWSFVDKIIRADSDSYVPDTEARKSFKFSHEDYVDAVVIPWYRLTDYQQFAYYVAEICTNLSPESPFTDKSRKFKTFREYYRFKYNIEILHTDQPLLDVDHTSARLNLLTPRYFNRKGRTLPPSTAKTRKESRESLGKKQLLIPELCSIHPFPASFWRKAVCLPCIFYRLNSLFLAEELRRKVAEETRIGFVEPPEDFDWPPLDFGWSVKDVMNDQFRDDSASNEEDAGHDESRDETPKVDVKKGVTDQGAQIPKASSSNVRANEARPSSPLKKKCGPASDGDSMGTFEIDYFDPSKYHIPDIPLDAHPSTNWMNIKLISCDSSVNNASSGWDQPLLQQDIFLEDTNEATWSDCEMEFDGEVTDKIGQVRCGSPSLFEPDSIKSATTSTTGFQANANVGFRKATSKTDILDEDEDDETGRQSGASNLRKQFSFMSSNLTKPSTNTQNSESSWSLTSDESGNSEEDSRSFANDWKDNKSKNGPLVREIFIPHHRSSLEPNDGCSVKILYDLLDSSGIDTPGGERSKTTEELNISADSALKMKFVDGKSGDQQLVEILRGVHKEKFIISDEDVSHAQERWYTLLKDLTNRIDSTLIEEPELFKDNSIELVTVDDSFDDFELEMQPTFGELLPNRDEDRNWTCEKWKNIKFDPTLRETRSEGPGPSIILQALTMSNASDGINLERLETVGDSFLKYSITAYLYCMNPTLHEGKLSYLRSTEISNANLYRLGLSKNFGELMSATKFEPNDNWLAPGYHVAESAAMVVDSKSSQQDEEMESQQSNEADRSSKKREIDKALAEVPYDLLLQHSIPDKSIADCVEALIGAHLTASGSRAALLFMRWLGLSVIPSSFDLDKDIRQVDELRKGEMDHDGDDSALDQIWSWLEPPVSPLICVKPSNDERVIQDLGEAFQQPSESDLRREAEAELERLYYASGLDKFERDTGYTFKDKAYLIQAFTHNSYYENHVTDCHQRLEFLGDALLDYLITRYLFEDPRCHSPGTLTDLRSALVNNTFFASLAVKYKFHKYLMYISDELFNVIDGFVKKLRFDSKDMITKGYTLLITEGESEYAEDIEVPKALGDVFESVAGAIFLDSGMSLNQVWEVYFEMMKPEIEYFCSNVPKSPIRELLESKPQNVRFSPSELAPDKKHRVIAEVFGLGRFTGLGRNKHSAKSTAAKRALRMLALKKRGRTAASSGNN